NMECFIDLLAGGRLDMAPLVGEVLPFEEAAAVYERMSAGQHKGLGVLFQYATDIEREHSRAVDSNVDATVPRRTSLPDKVRIGVIGCGNYAKSMILPHLASRSDVSLVEVVTTRSLSAADAQAKFGFERASTDASRLLASEDVDAVLIMTRHA